MRPLLLDIGKSNVAAITNNVNEQRVRYLALDLLHVKKMVGRAVCPAPNSLLAADFLHNDTQEIATAIAFTQDPLADLTRVQFRHTKHLAPQPYGQELLTIRPRSHSPKSRDQQIEDIGFRPIHCKISRREQHVIKERRP